MKYAILAGGGGTRLWPLSRKNFAKQFLKLTNNLTMLQNTALRASKLKGADIYTISNEESKNTIYSQLSEIFNDFDINNLITEPVGRNTAPAIAFSSLFFDKDDVIAILSSDHYIKNEKKFNDILLKAEKLALKDYIVTLGIVPDSPKTGYGYIKKSREKIDDSFFVEKFVEKPTLEKANEYINDGNYFWNGGIFIFKISLFLDELKKHDPELFGTLQKIKAKNEKNQAITLDDYIKFKAISIDYSLMEKTNRLVVIPSDIGWNDIGGFKSLYEVHDKDADNNAILINKDDFINIDSKNLLISGENKKIAVINLNNLAIIDTEDALLISDIENTEKVKTVYESLNKKNSKICEEHKKVLTDWGQSEILIRTEGYFIKKITISSNKTIDLYKNDRKCKNITVLSGSIELIYKNSKKILKEKESVLINPEEDLKINSESKIAEILEISFN